jgi:hypothetical protein
MIQDNFVGKGAMKEFVENTNKTANALNNAIVVMPPEYGGEIPTFSIITQGGDTSKLVLDMEDALVFSLANVKWVFRGTATFVNWAAFVNKGKLHIEVTANA